MDNLGGPSSKRKIEVIDITDADDDAYNPSPARLRKAAATITPESQVEYDNEAEQASGQEADDEVEQYGIIDVKIVGTRYYDGIATMGEQVLLKREPGNAVCSFLLYLSCSTCIYENYMLIHLLCSSIGTQSRLIMSPALRLATSPAGWLRTWSRWSTKT
jgi:hypothetical protein